MWYKHPKLVKRNWIYIKIEYNLIAQGKLRNYWEEDIEIPGSTLLLYIDNKCQDHFGMGSTNLK